MRQISTAKKQENVCNLHFVIICLPDNTVALVVSKQINVPTELTNLNGLST